MSPITTLSKPSHRTLAESLLADIAAAIDPRVTTQDKGRALSSAHMPWEDWCRKYYPNVCRKPFANRHIRVMEWFDSLDYGEENRPRVECWARGGGKSTVIELGVVRLCAKLNRRFVMYVSDSFAQAEKHVQAVSTLMSEIGVERRVNPFGVATGWRKSELQTDNGFNVAAFGLDTASRGTKIDNWRPDVLVFDDLDQEHDTPRTTQRKIDLITKSIIPAGSDDVAIIFVQNMIQEDGIMAQLCDGRADFLLNRYPAVVEPAVFEMETRIETGDNGLKRYVICAGRESWEGQNIAICERQIAKMGKTAFDRECQHIVTGSDGIFFEVSKINYIEAHEVPAGLRWGRAWDLAATEGGGDFTAGLLGGMQDIKDGDTVHHKFYLRDLRHGQWSSDNARKQMRLCVMRDKDDIPEGVKLWFPREPGPAGKDQAEKMEASFKSAGGTAVDVPRDGGGKAARARDFQECLNLGNVYVVRADWNIPLRKELLDFREDGTHLFDDIVDTCSTCYNGLQKKKKFDWDSIIG